MFNEPAISMRELELESAELLPSRETLCVSQMQWFPRRRFFGGGWGGFGGFDGGFGVDSFAFPGEFGFGGCGGFGGFDDVGAFGFPGEFGFGGCGC
jgi:hypothetical protein